VSFDVCQATCSPLAPCTQSQIVSKPLTLLIQAVAAFLSLRTLHCGCPFSCLRCNHALFLTPALHCTSCAAVLSPCCAARPASRSAADHPRSAWVAANASTWAVQPLSSSFPLKLQRSSAYKVTDPHALVIQCGLEVSVAPATACA
jgi:hypothetical protein